MVKIKVRECRTHADHDGARDDDQHERHQLGDGEEILDLRGRFHAVDVHERQDA